MFSKKLLVYLLFGNACLFVCLLWRSLSGSSVPAIDSTLAHAAAEPSQMGWSDLKSDDYPTYVNNLTTIGCPERIIRAIIETELDEAFAKKRAPLLAKIELLNTKEGDRALAQAELQELEREKLRIIEELFGAKPRPTEPEPRSVTTGQGPRKTRVTAQVDATATAPPAMPLVFRSVDTNQFQVSDEDLAIIERVREDFIAQLGTNQDITSLDYLQKWQKGQRAADDLLSALLGRQTWLQYQQAAQEPEPPTQ